ncbi:DUF6602 domain-containing protein [Bacilliculturomica massiliensis]|uniref:DUF6602 domain-containing protein n=1 Tax=Bacilliculturomica massiliensis TaxID=1917867 RepID=UPI001A91AF0B|nr:DUF6602 domain-containing protein [Bacilliculturomica massiliensis]
MAERKQLTKQERIEKTVQNIVANYKSVERSIVSQLELYNIHHPGTIGHSREDIWRQLFDMIIPKKFVIEHSVFIIDSWGDISKEVDLAIIDNMYTPYIFQYGKLKFVPIEAVAAVIECKSTDACNSPRKKKNGEKSDSSALEEWYKSIEALKTSNKSIARMAAGTVIHGVSYTSKFKISESTQTSTRPIRIFCGYKTAEEVNNLLDLFDFVLIAAKGKDTGIEVYSQKRTLKEWYDSLDHHEGKAKKFGEEHSNAGKDETEIHCGEGGNSEEKQIEIEPNPCNELNDYKLEAYQVKDEKGENVSLLSFNFQLNQLLMIINNPILFPHLAYADLFKRNMKLGTTEEGATDQGKDQEKERTDKQGKKSRQSKAEKNPGKTEKIEKTEKSEKNEQTKKVKRKGGNDGGEND